MDEGQGFVEDMERVAPGDHQHGASGGIGKSVGITIAMLGVLLALSSALVGGQRTELIATMVEQANAGTKFQALSTKYRVLLAQLQQLHSLMPDPERFQKWDEESRKLQTQISSADLGRISRIIRLENAKNLGAEIPTKDDLLQFVTRISALEKEQEAAREWTESFNPAIAVHSRAAEHYEWSQLASEIGIVIASVALLFSNRKAWFLSVGLGVATVVIAGITFVTTTTQLHTAEKSIEESKAQFDHFNSDAQGKAADEELLNAIKNGWYPEFVPQ
jgi:hypothetical protein